MASLRTSPADLADLRLIGQIRNKFAHMLHGLSVEALEVKSRCLKLQAAEGVLGGALLQDPRQMFIVSVVLLAHRLGMSAEAAKHQRRTVGPPYEPGKLVLESPASHCRRLTTT